MPLTKLQFQPGINRETTSYTNEGGWFDMDKVRFRFGFPEKIGGWEKISATYFLGTCRSIHPWVALDRSRYLGIGTHLKYYINEGGGYNDITPIRETTSAGDVTFSANANTLSAAVLVGDQTICLTSTSGFPESGIIKINSEIISYAALSGNDLTGCVRALEGTTEASHSPGAAVLCSTLIVSDTDHDAEVDDFVTFSDASSLGGNITADVINQEYQITSIINANSYQVEAREVTASLQNITTSTGYSPTYVFATASDGSNGGGSTVGAYQINTGLDTAIVGNGWGAGTWSRGAWGSGSAITTGNLELRIWTHDNFGEDLLLCPRDGGIYYWDKTNGTSARAVNITSLTGSINAPQVAKQIMVSDHDRHVIAFGCDPEGGGGVQDPLLIRFSDQESITDWSATANNTAGDLRIGSGSEIIMAVETRQQVLVFTDVSLHAMQFLGPPFTFGVSTISENITVAGPNAAASVEDNVFWMGAEEFYVYGGTVQRIPCTVRDYVFSNFNSDQAQKVYAATNTAFSEVWWFYPPANSSENDSYVVYNYQQKLWYYGTIARTAWLDRGVEADPIAASTDHALYFHEVGFDDGSANPATGITSYIESSQMDIGDGDNFVFLRRMIPDLTFRSSSAQTPLATMTLKTRNFPGGQYLQSNAKNVTKTASVPVEQFTDQVHVRLRGRSFAFRIESDQVGTAWRLGSPRVDIQPDGRR
ncbi:MAG: hypothetical protein CMJ25_19570 [Phycisphaerae bacterium]|nr:hypothetical protein [Phycisphaerae bacterium]